MADVRLFISYSSQYQQDVDDLAHVLRSRGADIWVDHAKLTPGTPNWQEAVRKGIEQSTHVIYAASPRANESLYVHAELQYAAYYQKPVIPFWLDGDAWIICAPMEMSRAQYIDARGTKRDDAKERLAESLGLTHQVVQGPVVHGSPISPAPVVDQSFVPARLQQLGFMGKIMNGVKVIIPPMVTISAGPFLMGSNKQKDPQAYDDEMPQHTVTLGEYAIGQYPLTVAEYACAVGQIVDGHKILAMLEPRQRRVGKPDHPVVYISWSDTQYYTRWLSQVTGQPWRMPTEAEWEKAARGTDGRIYPYGNTFDATKGNTREGRKGMTTAVGSYPEGASPYGVLDMSGNVFEWCCSEFKGYPYNGNDGRENLNSPNNRIVRGGSWNDVSRFARATCRVRLDLAGNFVGNFVGARLVLSRGQVQS